MSKDADEHHAPTPGGGADGSADPMSRTARISSRLSSAVRDAANAERAQNVLGTKLLAGGMALVAVAGGLDYFHHADAIYQAMGGLATDAGQGDFVSAVQGVNHEVDVMKVKALASLPPAVRDHLAGAALALAAKLIGFGVRLKLRFARGRLVRDVGRILAAPGFLGILGFVVVSWRGVAVLRSTTIGFTTKFREGALSWGDMWAFMTRYGPFAWEKVGAVLILGVLLVVASLGIRLLWIRKIHRADLLGQVLSRSTLWAGVLAIVFYFAATAIAVVSYGGALRVLTWPWKTNRGAFLVTLGFMALGLGMARTGTLMMRREAADDAGAEGAAAPA